ncbi:CaiB/BaiF CoA transferase family protein [Peribacillus frigoritolerans]|uniref:CaiB/BaiF CoA transferase family protein n=1 Tax=Peribacillus frigoritolerans TaxID=450367 RepID=UPI00381E3EBB
MGFLSPYRVLDLTNERGLLTGKIFADLGADVIQIEPIGGSSARKVGPFVEEGPNKGSSLFWEAYACNKRGISCDLDSEEGKEIFRKLYASSDFFFESESPGIMAQRGLSYEQLRGINPRVIYVSITPFGSFGPKASYADSDIVIWAAGNALYSNRELDRPPVRVSLPQSYMHASADAAVGALIAHFARLKSGLGQHVDISAQRSVAQCSLSRVLSMAVGDPNFEKGDLGALANGKKRTIDESGSGNRTGRSKWEVKDGYVELHLAMGPAAGRFTNNLMVWLYHEGVIDEETAKLDWIQVPNLLREERLDWDEIDRIYELIGNFLRRFSKLELMEAALKWKVLLAPIYSVMDLAESPHLAARQFWEDIEGSKGRRLLVPGRFARTSVDGFEFKRLAPFLGEHNYEVLTEILGLSDNYISYLELNEVI